MADDSLLELVNSAIATLIEVKQRLEEGEGIADKPQSSDGWKPVDFFDNTLGPVTAEEMQQAQVNQSNASPESTYTAPQEPANTASQEPAYFAPQETAYTMQQEPVYTTQQEPINTAQPELKIQTRFCRNCGNELSPGSRFCRECGKPID